MSQAVERLLKVFEILNAMSVYPVWMCLYVPQCCVYLKIVFLSSVTLWAKGRGKCPARMNHSGPDSGALSC